MSKIGVWLDERNAVIVKVFNDSTRKPEVVKLGAPPEPEFTSEREEHEDSHRDMARRERDLRLFFKDIAAELTVAESLAILGPGPVKSRFKHELEHKHPRLAAIVVATEGAEKLPERQLVARVRKLFHKKAPRWVLSNNRRGNRSGSLKHDFLIKAKTDQDT